MTEYEKLKGIIDEIDILIGQNITSSAPSFQAWKTKTERYLISHYGDSSYELKKFREEHFSLMFFTTGTPESAFVKACISGLKTTKAIFETYLQEMNEKPVVTLSTSNNSDDFSKIFIVHGHDGELKQSVARLIEKQEIEAVILFEQVNQGLTIIEKFEKYSEVGGAICLFTADDLGRTKGDKYAQPRARQNVVLETGYFMGKLGRDHIVILADTGIEMPSDLSGVVYTNTANWQVDLLRELKAMGYAVDFNKLF